jgi:hypothetical protein
MKPLSWPRKLSNPIASLISLPYDTKNRVAMGLGPDKIISSRLDGRAPHHKESILLSV